MRPLSSLLIVLTCLVTAVSGGAASALPEPGMRIRVTARAPERERWIGPLVSVARDTVTMHAGEVNGAIVTVPTLHVERFEISRGNHRNGLRGAGVGFAFGALVGAVIGAGSGDSGHDPNDLLVSSRGESTAAGALIFGVLGVAIGAGIGALIQSERWHALPLDDLRGTTQP